MNGYFKFMAILVIAMTAGSVASDWLTAKQFEICLKYHTPAECKVLTK